MSPEPRPWLPANALIDPATTARLTQCVEAWARRWFVDPRMPSVRLVACQGRASLASDALCLRNATGELLLSLPRTAHFKLADSMLGLRSRAKLSLHDNALLGELELRCLKDLSQEAASLFGISTRIVSEHSGNIARAVHYAFALPPLSDDIHLFIDVPAAMTARRARLGSTNRPVPLGSRQDAIAKQRVGVGAFLGAGEVGLSDLYGLACGDVLRINREQGPLPLTINGKASPGMRCEPIRDGSVLKLRLCEMQPGEQL